jgi:hypothetical protein
MADACAAKRNRGQTTKPRFSQEITPFEAIRRTNPAPV